MAPTSSSSPSSSLSLLLKRGLRGRLIQSVMSLSSFSLSEVASSSSTSLPFATLSWSDCRNSSAVAAAAAALVPFRVTVVIKF